MSTSRPDVIAIVGTTGVGKSQLAIELASALSGKQGEVINADSMQVYRGLDIITNKATHEEMQGVPHHLMDFLEPGQEYRVDRFRTDAMHKIEEITSRDCLPILVGGTMYFMQHLLFPGHLVSAEDTSVDGPTTTAKSIDDLSSPIKDRALQLPQELLELLFLNPILPSISTSSAFPPDYPVERLPVAYRTCEALSAGLHQVLQVLDPPISAKWHWKDIRKIRRSLDIILQTGRLYSDIIAEQKEETMPAPYRTLIFWLYAEPQTLEPRLDTRVGAMTERGLLQEILELRKLAKDKSHIDMSKGIYQSIGYKEFSAYLDATERDERDFVNEERLFRAALAEMQIGTKQYARRQVKWIRNKLLPAIQEQTSGAGPQAIHLYLLDATDLSKWNEQVRSIAIDLTQDFVGKQDLPSPESISPVAQSMLATKRNQRSLVQVKCEVCTVDPARPFLVEEGEMAAHKGSRGHRRAIQRRERPHGRSRPSAPPKMEDP